MLIFLPFSSNLLKFKFFLDFASIFDPKKDCPVKPVTFMSAGSYVDWSFGIRPVLSLVVLLWKGFG